MRVKFDYLDNGTVLGHKRRCEILREAVIARGHDIAVDGPDWLVVDYPLGSFPQPTGERRLVMGTLPLDARDWAWHPLGEPGNDRTLYGARYIVLSPEVEKYLEVPKTQSLLVTCGGSDPMHLTERLLDILPSGSFVVGPNFGREVEASDGWQRYGPLSYDGMLMLMARHRSVVCAWGNTAFEAAALGAHVVAVTIREEYEQEAERLGMPFVTKDELEQVPEVMGRASVSSYGIDTLGAQRVVEFMERKC